MAYAKETSSCCRMVRRPHRTWQNHWEPVTSANIERRIVGKTMPVKAPSENKSKPEIIVIPSYCHTVPIIDVATLAFFPRASYYSEVEKP